MNRFSKVSIFVTLVLAALLIGAQTPSFAAMRTVELRVPGCV
jgi:hypothetical protein